jgi:hypothetical protein
VISATSDLLLASSGMGKAELKAGVIQQAAKPPFREGTGEPLHKVI